MNYFTNGSIATLSGLGVTPQTVTIAYFKDGLAEVLLSDGTRRAGLVTELDYISHGEPIERKLIPGAKFKIVNDSNPVWTFLSWDAYGYEYINELGVKIYTAGHPTFLIQP